MQKNTGNSANQLVQDQSLVGNLPQQVIQFFQSRIQTQQNYAKALQRLNNKFPNIEAHPTQSSKVLKHLKAIHSQKYHQTIQFIEQLKSQKQTFQSAIAKSNQQLQKAANQVKVFEVNLKTILQKINKINLKGQQQIKIIDEKFILKQLSLIGSDYKMKKIEDSLKILQQQVKVRANLQKQYQQLKYEGQKIIKKIKKMQKIILETSPQIQKQIIQLVKKYTVQQVSLIRNLQYDIDIMIKKTNIFDEPEPNATQVSQKSVKMPKNHIIKAAKETFKKQFITKDPFQEIKLYIANLTEQSLKNMQIKKDKNKKNSQQFEQLIKNWNDEKSTSNLLMKLNENYQKYKDLGYQFIQYFRNKNINKFPAKQFNEIQKIFQLVMQKSIQEKDFQNIQKLIVYGSCYCLLNQKNDKNFVNVTMMQSLSKNEFLSNIHFWRFLLYFVIQRSVVECINIQNQKNMHLKNNVFSALVSNSLNMIGCGIDKYVTKNTVAKIGKSFGLADSQIGDLLKFIESGYQKYQKQKGKK